MANVQSPYKTELSVRICQYPRPAMKLDYNKGTISLSFMNLTDMVAINDLF